MSTTIPKFDNNYPNKSSIKLCNNVYIGSTASVEYLQQSPSESNEEFKNRKISFAQSSFFFNGIESIVDIVFRKPISFSDDIRDDIKEMYLHNVDGLGTSFNYFAKEMFRTMLLSNKCLTEVWTEESDAERPYLKSIDRNRILDYNLSLEVPMMIIEGVFNKQIDRYTTEYEVQQKIYFANGEVEVWKKKERQSLIQTGYKQIPIVISSLIGGKNNISTDEPPFLDLAKLQIRWNETDSRKQQFVNRLAIPTVLTWGVNLQEMLEDPRDGSVTLDSDGTYKVQVAGSRGLSFPINSDGNKMGDLEFRELDGKNDEVLGRNLLEVEANIKKGFVQFLHSKSGNKTVEESKNERVGAESKLASYADTLEESLNEINALFYNTYGATKGTGNVGKISVNKEFINQMVSELEIEMLDRLNENGKITDTTYLKQLQNGGMLKGLNIEDELKKKEAGVN